uniref:Uncharacterized protein n=1 Tax=Arundo donax TaxID=35708 RepID=A0A0A9G119_ARUDO
MSARRAGWSTRSPSTCRGTRSLRRGRTRCCRRARSRRCSTTSCRCW